MIFLLKNSKEFLFSNEVDLMLLTLFCRDIVCRERLRARTSWAFLLWEGARWGIWGEVLNSLSGRIDDLGLNSEEDTDFESRCGNAGTRVVEDVPLRVLEEGK